MMLPRRFEWALRTRGPDIQAWPVVERDAALLLLRSSARARDALADALATEDTVAADAEADPAALRRMGGVVQQALRPPSPLVRGLRWGGIAACVAAGLYLGLPAETDAAAVLAAATSPIEAGVLGSDSPSMVLAALD